MLALAGCASAGDTAAASEAAPAESTAESAAAEDSTEAALPGEPHPSAYSACAVSGSSVYTAVSHFQAARTVSAALITAPSTKPTLPPGRPMRCTAPAPQLASAPLIIDDTLYFICYDGGMLALPTTGGEARVLPFSYDDWMPVLRRSLPLLPERQCRAVLPYRRYAV